jgi:ectoine hydroxylase-related dioxygenase (phytanoyl-CoA dioxygenase family)
MDIRAEREVTDISDFHRHGVLVFKNLFEAKQIQAMRNEIQRIQRHVLQKIQHLPRPLKPHSDITERHLNRLDYRCGFTADIFQQVAQPVIKIIQRLSPQIDFRHYWGAIPTLAGAGPTNMHRDVYSFVNTTEGVNLDALDTNMPPYYFTVLIPLMQITPQNGPTQFIKGSHRELIVDESDRDIYVPLLSVGDAVIFDGRTLHKGSANNSQEERLVAYITFVANWYHDQTFEINHYLFPELPSRTY